MFNIFKLDKYRIVQENNKFYPEQRYGIFFWSRLSIWCDKIVFFKDASFNTLQEAEKFLKIQISKETKSNKIIHKF